ncbi:MAG: hypothetical protein ABJN42_29770 [Roseibium sp.]|uniref:DUF6915 family protein n=1 Tax=Roseibium sp. TaxID=1936156 RepID=UPI003298E85E
MSHPWHHAESSARKYGGKPEDYVDLHSWFDESKGQLGNFRHRALRHHAFGIFELERVFGVTITNSDGRKIPTRFIGEQHVKEDCGGMIPTVQDWLRKLPGQRWMHVGDLRDDQANPEIDPDYSVEAWRADVAAGKTTLGHIDWSERMRMVRGEV